jgi:hypothetical protein
MKPKLSVYLSDHVADRLALAAKRPGANKSTIVDAALDRFLNPERDKTGDAALVRRLDRMSSQLDRIDRDLGITAETLALFVRYYLTITPPLPRADQDAARSLGRERFEMFVAEVGKRVGSGARLVTEVLDKVSTSKPDVFARQLDERTPLGQRVFDQKGFPAGDAGSARPGRSPARREEVGHV